MSITTAPTKAAPEVCAFCQSKLEVAFFWGRAANLPFPVAACLTCGTRWANGMSLHHIVDGTVV